MKLLAPSLRSSLLLNIKHINEFSNTDKGSKQKLLGSSEQISNTPPQPMHGLLVDEVINEPSKNYENIEFKLQSRQKIIRRSLQIYINFCTSNYRYLNSFKFKCAQADMT